MGRADRIARWLRWRNLQILWASSATRAEDDEDFRGELSAIRDAIGRNLAALLGRSKRKNFRLWQDVEAIAPGKMWGTEIAKAIEEFVFFVPIVTPRGVASPYCKSEFELFLAREKALGRSDLVFPILYIRVPAFWDEAKRRKDRVLAIVAERQFVDWQSFRYADVNSEAFGREIGRFCEKIAETLNETWISPGERRELEAEAKRRAEEEERIRQEAQAKRKAAEQERLRNEAKEQRAPLTAATVGIFDDEARKLANEQAEQARSQAQREVERSKIAHAIG